MTTKEDELSSRNQGEKREKLEEKGILDKIMSNLETIKHPSS